MEEALFKVQKPGLLTTVQDLGRTGYQQFGMSVSGAMDVFALQVGNLLVGNQRGEAGLEITVMGPQLRIQKNAVLAVCGADLSPTLDQSPVPMWQSFQVRKGQTLRFHQPYNGARSYITVAGGLDVPEVMGSKSTYIKAQVGGIQGRELQKGDIVKGGKTPPFEKRLISRRLVPSAIPDYASPVKVRVVLGPDHNVFPEESIRTFLSECYEVSSQSDRMGYRLKGPQLTHKVGADIVSDAIFPGTIQVPASGEPIVLLADRQTTGGYTRIGTVISVDLPYLAQMLPGQSISFQAVSVEEAQEYYIRQEKLLREISLGAGVFARG